MRWLVLAILLTLSSINLDAAHAIEMHCVEASKYKYLYKIFGDDRRRMAEFLQVDADRLPDGEVCRAALVTGSIDPPATSKKAGRPVDGDLFQEAIGQNHGWLATVYLASSGGNVRHGLQLGQMTRMFWLKTRSLSEDRFLYRPDFLPVDPAAPFTSEPTIPAELTAGWQDYLRAIEPFQFVSVAAADPTQKRPRCASACTFMHVAGVDRIGTAFVHRGRPGRGDKSTMAESVESLHRAEQAVLAHFRNMDTGPDFMRETQDTPTATVAPALTDRFPRYIWDALHARCRKDFGSSAPQAGQRPPQTLSPRGEHCIAAAHEKERLAQFEKYCPGGACNRSLILERVNAYVNELFGKTPQTRQPSQGKPDDREASGPGWYCRARPNQGSGKAWARRSTRDEAARRALEVCESRIRPGCHIICCVPPSAASGRSGTCER